MTRQWTEELVRMVTVSKACRKLRDSLNQSQQALAGSLGISLGALRNYENEQSIPDAHALAAYMAMADVVQEPGLTEVFGVALEQRLGMSLARLAAIRAATTNL